MNCTTGFGATLASDPRLLAAVVEAFGSLHRQELRMVRQAALDGLLARLTEGLHWRRRLDIDPRLPLVLGACFGAAAMHGGCGRSRPG